MIEIEIKGCDAGNKLHSKESFDSGYFDNKIWLVFAENVGNIVTAVFSDYDKLCEWVKNTDKYGRVEAYEDGVDQSKLEKQWQTPHNSHMHFGYDPDAVGFTFDYGDCDVCEEEYEEDEEAEILSRVEDDIGQTPCVMEIYLCARCGKTYASLGVEGKGILRFHQEYEGEEFKIEELYEEFVKYYEGKENEKL